MRRGRDPRGSGSPLGHGACFSDPPLRCQASVLWEPLFFQSNWIACCSQNSPAVSPSRFWFQAFVSVWNVLSPICSNHFSSRSLPSGQLHQARLPAPYPTSPSPASRAVTARVCPGSSPRPGCACRKGGGRRHRDPLWLLPAPPVPGGGGALPGGAARVSCMRQQLSLFPGRVDSHTDQPSPLRPLAASSVARPLYFLSARGALWLAGSDRKGPKPGLDPARGVPGPGAASSGEGRVERAGRGTRAWRPACWCGLFPQTPPPSLHEVLKRVGGWNPATSGGRRGPALVPRNRLLLQPTLPRVPRCTARARKGRGSRRRPAQCRRWGPCSFLRWPAAGPRRR